MRTSTRQMLKHVGASLRLWTPMTSACIGNCMDRDGSIRGSFVCLSSSVSLSLLSLSHTLYSPSKSFFSPFICLYITSHFSSWLAQAHPLNVFYTSVKFMTRAEMNIKFSVWVVWIVKWASIIKCLTHAGNYISNRHDTFEFDVEKSFIVYPNAFSIIEYHYN